MQIPHMRTNPTKHRFQDNTYARHFRCPQSQYFLHRDSSEHAYITHSKTSNLQPPGMRAISTMMSCNYFICATLLLTEYHKHSKFFRTRIQRCHRLVQTYLLSLHIRTTLPASSFAGASVPECLCKQI